MAALQHLDEKALTDPRNRLSPEVMAFVMGLQGKFYQPGPPGSVGESWIEQHVIVLDDDDVLEVIDDIFYFWKMARDDRA